MRQPIESETWRLFLAISVPERIKEAISEAQSRLRGAAPHALIRWTKREQFHLTLRFLGDISAEQVGPLTRAAGAACREFAPMRLRASQIGFFPNERRPRVVWAGISNESGRLPLLHRAIQEATDPFTQEEAEGNFTGHITLGRIKILRHGEAEDLAVAAGGMAANDSGEWTATEVELLRSKLLPQGAQHTVIAALPLGGEGRG